MSQLFTHRQTHALTPLLFHSPTLTSPNAVQFYAEWEQAPWISRLAPDWIFLTSATHSICFCILFFLFLFFLITPSQICSLLQTKNRKKKKKTWKKNSHFLPLKNKLNGKKKTQVFFFFLCVYIYICFSNSRHNVYLYSNPSSLPGSVCEHGVTWAGLSAHTALHLSCVHFKHCYKEMRLFWLRERPPSRNQW